MYAAEQYDFTKNYGNAYLTAGKHSLSFRLVGTGRNAASDGYDLTFGGFTLSKVVPDAENAPGFSRCGEIYVGAPPVIFPFSEKEVYSIEESNRVRHAGLASTCLKPLCEENSSDARG